MRLGTWRCPSVGTTVHRSPVLVSSAPLFDPHGKLNAAVVIFENITERKRAENKLAYQEDLIESVSDAIISVDQEGTIRTWNRAAESIYGYKAGEVIGRPIVEFLGTHFFNDKLELATEHMRKNGQWHGEVEQKRRDGTPLIVLSSVSYASNRLGEPHILVAVNRDITNIRKKDRALIESEERFRSLIEQAPLAIAIARQGLTIYANNRYLKMFGLSSVDEIYGHPLTEQIVPEERDRVMDLALRHDKDQDL